VGEGHSKNFFWHFASKFVPLPIFNLLSELLGGLDQMNFGAFSVDCLP